jgi:hypothetical protein
MTKSHCTWISASVVTLLALAATPGCTPAACPACDDPSRAGTLENLELDELSGLAASSQHADVLYGHNDSGDSSRVFALATDGTHLATFDLEDSRNDDWEDIAHAPCDAGHCLWIADIGDNDSVRTEYQIYLMSEPTAIEAGTHSVPSERVTFTYPDGAHDAEVLLVHPLTGDVTIVTKVEEGPASIYALPPLESAGTLEATRVGEVTPPDGRSKFTGGSVHPDAKGILLRTNSRLFHWPMAPEQTVAEALAGQGCQLPLAEEVQGEAVAWLPAGEGFVTIGEGLNAPINASNCEAS